MSCFYLWSLVSFFLSGSVWAFDPPPQQTPLSPQTKRSAPQGTNVPSKEASETPPKKAPAPPDKSADPPKPISPPAAKSEPNAGQVTVTPEPCLPGQTVTLQWPPRVTHALYRDRGRLIKLPVIDGASSFVAPQKTTTVVFQLSYAADPITGARRRHKGRNISSERGRDSEGLASRRVRLTLQVFQGKFPQIATYRDQHLWHIDSVGGWVRNSVFLPDPKNNALFYFQPQPDSPERVAVSILPVTNQSSEDLMKQVINDAPTKYDVIKEVAQKETMQCGVPAVWLTFSGLDQALAGLPTRSMVLTFVKNGHGYVISGRARSSQFKQWDKVLRCLVRSFSLDTAPPTSQGRSSRKNSPP